MATCHDVMFRFSISDCGIDLSFRVSLRSRGALPSSMFAAEVSGRPSKSRTSASPWRTVLRSNVLEKRVFRGKDEAARGGWKTATRLHSERYRK